MTIKPSLKRDVIARLLVLMDEELDNLTVAMSLDLVIEIREAEESLSALNGALGVLGYWKKSESKELAKTL